MAKIEGDILIKAPKEKAWAFLTDVEKLPDWMPLLTEVSDVQGEGVGRSYNWGYKFMGIKFKGKNKVIEEIPNQKNITEAEGGIKAKWDWDFASEGEDTKVHVIVDFNIPGPVLGKFVEGFVVKQSKRELDHALENLKHMVET